LKPVLDDPAAAVNEAAFSWYPKEGWLGVAMRTDRWRFVEWTKSGETPIRELYDMNADPQNDRNIADRSEHAALCESLGRQLRERFPVQEYQPPPTVKK
jgi:iduronate 2-sulfatase